MPPLTMATKTQVPSLYKASQGFLFRMAPRGTAYSTQQLFERKEILTSIYAQSNGFKKRPKKMLHPFTLASFFSHFPSIQTIQIRHTQLHLVHWEDFGVVTATCHPIIHSQAAYRANNNPINREPSQPWNRTGLTALWPNASGFFVWKKMLSEGSILSDLKRPCKTKSQPCWFGSVSKKIKMSINETNTI